MGFRGGVQQSHVEVPAGQGSLFISINFIFTFQAGLTIAEVHLKEKPEDAEPEALRMEHFFLPLGIWVVGIVISLFCFVAEIINNRRRKSKNLAMQEDPSETKPTPESETSQRSRQSSSFLPAGH